MKLYYSPGACSMAVHIAVREAGLDVDPVRVDLATHKLDDGSDYHAVSPNGYVPLLELDDGSRHTEAAALLQYVADLAPGDALIPAVGTAGRFEVQKWLAFTASELHKAFGPLWHKETPDATVAQTRAHLAKRFRAVEQHLAAHEYLVGNRFTVADAYAYTILNWSHFLKLDLQPYPAIRAYLERIAARPAVREVSKVEGLTGG